MARARALLASMAGRLEGITWIAALQLPFLHYFLLFLRLHALDDVLQAYPLYSHLTIHEVVGSEKAPVSRLEGGQGRAVHSLSSLVLYSSLSHTHTQSPSQ